jgi:hypothetical protein
MSKSSKSSKSNLPLDENSTTSSRPASPKPKPVAKVSSPVPHHSLPKQGQKYASLLQTAGIQSAFISKRTATDFMSSYGGHSTLPTRVYEVGLGIDELATARSNYLLRRKELDTNVRELGRHLPNGPYLPAILKKILTIDPPRHLDLEKVNPQIPTRHLPSSERPSRDQINTSTPAPAGLQQPKVMATTHERTPALPTSSPSGQSPSMRRQPTPPTRRGYSRCRICNGLGHLQTQCRNYFCVHCKTTSPGHFAKFCPRNPYPGVDRRNLPTSALAILESMETRIASTTTPTSGAPRTITNSNVQPNVSGISTAPNTRAKLSIANVDAHARDTATLPRVTITLGPTYKPVFTPPRPATTRATKDLGKLRQLDAPINPPSGRKTSDHRQSTQQPSQRRPRSPEFYEGNHEDNYDDVAWYNIDGEGHFD